MSRSSVEEPPPGMELLELTTDEGTFIVMVEPMPFDTSMLTAAEREILLLIASGATDREIGKQRGTSQRTVANQCAQLFQKLGVSGRRELASRFIRVG